MLNGDTKLIAHVGYPTTTFKSSMIYNPWFEKRQINAAVVPMGVRRDDFGRAFPEICRFTNFHGALITMPHKVAVIALLEEVSTAVKVAGSCNAVRRADDGRLIGDMFDGEGFVRGVAHNSASLDGRRLLVVGSGGVGSAIAASAAAAGAAEIALYDVDAAAMRGLGDRLRQNYPYLAVSRGSNDPSGFDIVVNATPLGTYPGDPMPLDVSRLMPGAFVAEVVMKRETTAFLGAAQAMGCRTQVGVDMLFEQIPAYLEFFGFPQATPEELRQVAEIEY
ncbi:MAG: shikimate dehydrogenase [Hyphomicrobiales bacterium]|nr:shikimate dehydrogenase [Hyphomicrobiales bacterium]